jgi:hypothetical protein
VERLQLAKLILNDIPEESLIDYSESWSDEDLTDFTQAGWRHVEELEFKNAESGLDG